MNKTFVAIASAFAVALPVVAQSAEMDVLQVYGTVHTSIDREVKNGNTSFDVDSSATRGWGIGAKGGMDAAGGLIAIYQFEIGYDGAKDTGINATDSNSDGNFDKYGNVIPGSFYLRDSWVGLKGGFGKVRIGTMGTYYKVSGAKIDPLFTTALEGRDKTFHMMSPMHSGNGIGQGRGSDMISYDSPLVAGMITVNAHLQPRGDEWNYGGGGQLRVGPATVFGALTTNEFGSRALKGGAQVVFGPAKIAAQYERGSALGGKQYFFGSGTFDITREAEVSGDVGYELDSGDISATGAFVYKMSKKSNLYVGYGLNRKGSDSTTAKYSVATLGLKHKF
ncbi:MAG: porin [Gammaproteobacteria bacterium]|nr:porin [Gammaproteobacteria bacterium]